MRLSSAFKTCLFLLCLLIVGPVIAGEADHLVLEDLVDQGFQKLDETTLSELFHKRKITVSDIETGEEFVVETGTGEFAKDGKLEKVRDASPGKMFSLDVAGRAAMLKNAHYTIEGDTIMATDGVRQYRLSFYKKDDTMYGVRDVDGGRVFFRVEK